MKTIYIILALTLIGCAQNRFDRLVRNHPDLIQTDTIIRIDTVKILVPRIEHDTAFIESHLYDTVIIEKERLKIKIWKEYDTIHVQGECDTLTVTEYIETIVPVKYYKEAKSYKWIIILIVIAFALYLLLTNRKRNE